MTQEHTQTLNRLDGVSEHDEGDAGPVAAQSGGGALSQAFVLLDYAAGSDRPSLLFTSPLEIIRADQPTEVNSALARLEQVRAQERHAAGYFAYELGYALENRLQARLPASRSMPLLWFGVYDAPQVLTSAQVEDWLNTHTRSASHRFFDLKYDWDRAAYLKRFEEVQRRIRAGDIYQLNLTFKVRFRLDGSPLTFYRDLRRKQPVAYGGIIDTGEATILSASPELFVAQRDGLIETRPMKGTAARAGLIEDDQAVRRVLAEDAKQRAENLMIVDLMRNDLGRIAKPGSVRVTDLFTVETYKTLHQMTSGVQAELRDDIGLKKRLTAIFPPGSVTGAPKIRAMELINDLEDEARGVYCGSIGHLSPDGKDSLNVVIRTPVIFRDGTGEMGIGSGVVFDSQGDSEYDECLLKMKFLTDPPKPFRLIETMLFEPGQVEPGQVGRGRGVWLREGHMRRLQRSADYFGFEFSAAEIAAAIDEAVALHSEVDGDANNPGVGRLRVRLTLGEAGDVEVTTTALGPAPAPGDTRMRYVVSPTRLDSTDAFLFHKTTRRDLYNDEWAAFSKACGADDVLYLNERGELAEGSRTNVFVRMQIGEPLLTPPLKSGLLPGVLRAELLATGEAQEQVLRLKDLHSAAEVWLGNSVRGLCRAVPVAAGSTNGS
ncbi:MAG: aminodeoxychorismate synthase component I [Pseudomonadota bacterium]